MLMHFNAVQIARRLDQATGIGIRRAHLAVANVLACGRPDYYRPDVLLLTMQEPDVPDDAPGDDCPEHGPYEEPGDCPHCEVTHAC